MSQMLLVLWRQPQRRVRQFGGLAAFLFSCMTERDFQELLELGRKRDEKVYAWLRYLIGLASGALAVLVSLQSHTQPGAAGIAQKIAWVSLGSGILFGSLRLYGEVWTARQLVLKLVAKRTTTFIWRCYHVARCGKSAEICEVERKGVLLLFDFGSCFVGRICLE